MVRYSLGVLNLILLLLCCGCSTGDDNLAEVTGEVTYYGKPCLAEITFQPINEADDERPHPSLGFTDARGSFRLQYTLDQTGAIVGEHHVTIKVLPSTESQELQSFQDATRPLLQVELKRTVRKEGNHFRFLLCH